MPKDAFGLLLHKYVSGAEVRAQKIDEYLDSGASIDYQHPNGFTILMVAADNGNEKAVEYSLNCGANPLLRNYAGKIASDLVSKNSGIYQILKGYELLFYVMDNDLFNTKLLLTHHETLINFRGRNGYTALLIAVQQNNLKLAEYLLSLNANLSICCDDGKGVLDFAADEDMHSLLKRVKDLPLDEIEISQPLFSVTTEDKFGLFDTSLSSTDDAEEKLGI